MKIYNNPNLNKKHCNGVIAIGNFDGLHLGHQKVINEARQKAKKFKLPLGIMTFEPVPVMFFGKKNKDHRINSLHQKISQLKKLKLDFLIIIRFNKTDKKEPPIGRVDRKDKKRIQDNYILNDVSMALWAKARSLHELGKIKEAETAYAQCLFLTHGRAWDPGGWFWNPSSDCIKYAIKLLNKK